MTAPAPAPIPRPAPMPVAVFAAAGPCQCGHEADSVLVFADHREIQHTDWRLPRCPAPNPKENR